MIYYKNLKANQYDDTSNIADEEDIIYVIDESILTN